MRRLLPLLTALALAPGCFWFTTKDEGAALRKRVDDLDSRQGKTEATLGEKVAKLDESLDKATKLLTRSSADIGSQVDQMNQDLATLTGEIEDLKRELAALRSQVQALKEENAQLRADLDKRLADEEQRIAYLEQKAGIKRGPGGQVTEELDATALYARAQKSVEAGKLDDARRDFRDFVRRFPQDGRADDAQLAIAESFGKEKAYDKAMGEYQKVIDQWPDGDMVDDALMGAAAAAEQLKWCLDARAYYGLLVQKYPKSSFAPAAQKKLDYLKKNAKKKDVCQT
jgi:TolA-binding protein